MIKKTIKRKHELIKIERMKEIQTDEIFVYLITKDLESIQIVEHSEFCTLVSTLNLTYNLKK